MGSIGAFEGKSGVDETVDGELRANKADVVEAEELVLDEPLELERVDNEAPVRKYDDVLDTVPEVTTVDIVEVQREVLTFTEAICVLVRDEIDTLGVGDADG